MGRRRRMLPHGPPRVLVVGQGPPTAGGIPTFVAQLVADPWLGERVRLEYLNTTPLGIKRPGAPTLSNAYHTFADAWTVLQLGRTADVVHLNVAAAPTLPLLRALLICCAARLAGSRVLLHAHTGQLARCTRGRVYRSLLRLGRRVVDSFVVVSRFEEAAVRGVVDKVVRLDNGIRVEEFRTGPKDADPPLLTFVGTVCDRKGLGDLREALVMLAADDRSPRLPLRVLIVGDARQEGPGVYEGVRGAYAEAGLSEVEFLGALDREGILDVLSRTSIFCLPSHSEGQPLSVLEGMAAGAAPLTTDVGEMPYMLDHGRAGVLVAPHDPPALAAAIDRLVRDPGERDRLGRAARERVQREYGQDRMIRGLLALYLGLVGQSM